MADRDELVNALVQADKAGDTRSAQLLEAEIRRMDLADKQPETFQQSLTKEVENAPLLSKVLVGAGGRAKDIVRGITSDRVLGDPEKVKEQQQLEATIGTPATVGRGLTDVAATAFPLARAAQAVTLPARLARMGATGAAYGALTTPGPGDEAAKTAAVTGAASMIPGAAQGVKAVLPKALELAAKYPAVSGTAKTVGKYLTGGAGFGAIVDPEKTLDMIKRYGTPAAVVAGTVGLGAFAAKYPGLAAALGIGAGERVGDQDAPQ